MKKVNFCKNLKTLQQEKNLGQKQLADLLNTTIKTISHWETGYSEPSLADLSHIAEIFEVSLDDLLWADL